MAKKRFLKPLYFISSKYLEDHIFENKFLCKSLNETFTHAHNIVYNIQVMMFVNISGHK